MESFVSYPERSANEPEITDPQRAFQDLFEPTPRKGEANEAGANEARANEQQSSAKPSKGPRVIMSEVPAAFRSTIDAPGSAFEVYEWVLRKLEEEPKVTLGELRRRAALVDCDVSEGHFERAQRELLRRQHAPKEQGRSTKTPGRAPARAALREPRARTGAKDLVDDSLSLIRGSACRTPQLPRGLGGDRRSARRSCRVTRWAWPDLGLQWRRSRSLPRGFHGARPDQDEA